VRVDIEAVAESLRDRLSPEDLALFDVYLGILDDSASAARSPASSRQASGPRAP
jgi:hypothetical protein